MRISLCRRRAHPDGHRICSVADNAIHQYPAADLTAMNLRRDAAGHHGERGRLRVRPRQSRDINPMRMPVDVDVDEHPRLPDGAEQLIRELFGIELRRCLRTIDGDDRLRARRTGAPSTCPPHPHRPQRRRPTASRPAPRQSCRLNEGSLDHLSESRSHTGRSSSGPANATSNIN